MILQFNQQQTAQQVKNNEDGFELKNIHIKFQAYSQTFSIVHIFGNNIIKWVICKQIEMLKK